MVTVRGFFHRIIHRQAFSPAVEPMAPERQDLAEEQMQLEARRLRRASLNFAAMGDRVEDLRTHCEQSGLSQVTKALRDVEKAIERAKSELDKTALAMDATW